MITTGSSYHAQVEEDGNGISHQIITWKADAVLRFLGQYHVSTTRLTFTLYPAGEPPKVLRIPEKVYAVLEEALEKEKSCESC